MKRVTSATFRDTFMEETEPVQVRRYTTLLGTWIPAGKEITMDETVRKGIEVEKAKPDRGQIRKGLGDLPGEAPKDADRSFREFRPAPKPGKKG